MHVKRFHARFRVRAGRGERERMIAMRTYTYACVRQGNCQFNWPGSWERACNGNVDADDRQIFTGFAVNIYRR